MAKKASGKKNTTAVVVAEPKTPSEISAGLARGLSTHYAELCKMARVAFRTSIAFGALIVVAQQKLEQAGLLKRGRGSEGEGLKGWLAKNCPEVNYNTAMMWKLRAERMIKGLGGDKNAIYATAGDVAYVCDDGKTIDIPSETLDKRDDIFKCETVAKFEQMMLDLFGDEQAKGRGRKPGSKANSSEVDTHIAKTAEEKAAAAEQEMREIVGTLGAFLTRGGKINMLTAQAKSDFHTALVDYAQLLEEQM